MYKELIHSVQGAVAFNLDNADKADVQRSSFTAGMIRAYLDVVRSMGHDVESGSWDDNGCDRFSYLKIDGVVLVKNSKLDMKAYSELLKK